MKSAIPVGIGVPQPWRHHASTYASLHTHQSSSSSITDLEVEAWHGAMAAPLRIWSSQHHPWPLVHLVEDASMGGKVLQVEVASQVDTSVTVLLCELGSEVLPMRRGAVI